MTVAFPDPNTLSAMSLLSGGGAFDRTLETTVSAATSNASGIAAQFSALPSQINGVESGLLANFTSFQTQATSLASTALPAFATHVTSQFDGLAQNIGLFASHQGLENALAGIPSGCSTMHSFFGSITQEGPQLMAAVAATMTQAQSILGQFTQLTQNLQGQITNTQTALISNLTTELGVTTDPAKILQIQSTLTAVQGTFNSAIAATRGSLVDQAKALLTGGRNDLIANASSLMKSIDSDLGIHGATMGGLSTALGGHSTSLSSLISNETSTITGAVSRLVSLGHVSSIKSLFSSNGCVQSLLGYVGTNNFLKLL